MSDNSSNSNKESACEDGMDYALTNAAASTNITAMPLSPKRSISVADRDLPDSVVGAREEQKACIRKKQNKLVRRHSPSALAHAPRYTNLRNNLQGRIGHN